MRLILPFIVFVFVTLGAVAQTKTVTAVSKLQTEIVWDRIRFQH